MTAANPDTILPAPRYVVRTVDEDRIDLFDPPARIDGKRAAWEEAKRRVRAHAECTTLVIDRHTGATLWRSEPDVPPRYEIVATDSGRVLSAHKDRDAAWSAFHDAVAEPRGEVIALRDTTPARTVLASSDEDLYRADAA